MRAINCFLWFTIVNFYKYDTTDAFTHRQTYMLRKNTMMTSSNGNIFRVTGPLCGEFTGPGEFHAQRPVTRSFDVFFDLRLNKRLSKQPWGRWFETPSWPLWRQCNAIRTFRKNTPLLQYLSQPLSSKTPCWSNILTLLSYNSIRCILWLGVSNLILRQILRWMYTGIYIDRVTIK